MESKRTLPIEKVSCMKINFMNIVKGESSTHEIVHSLISHEQFWRKKNHPRKFLGQNVYFHGWNFTIFIYENVIIMHENFIFSCM